MANLVVHFEIHASEPERLIDFYRELLGWRFTQFGDAPYWSIETGEGPSATSLARRGMVSTAVCSSDAARSRSSGHR